MGEMSKAVAEAVRNLSAAQMQSADEVAETCRLAARRWFNKTYDKKPVTKVHVMRL
jgi:ribonuclease J